MSFFNNKEDVIHFELTPYGRYILSKGEFDPAYYEFCDEEIIYDNDHTGASEELKDGQNRIKNEYVKMRDFVNVFSCDVAKSKDYSIIDYISNHSSLGNSTISSKYAPSWTVSVLNGEISSSVATQVSDTNTKKFAQINFSTGSFEIFPSTDENEYASDESVSDIFIDESFLKVDDDYLFLDISEQNTENLIYNFDLELYEVKYDNDGNEILEQFDPNSEQYFEILVDGEIEPEFYCEHKRVIQEDNFYVHNIPGCITKKPEKAEKPYDNIIVKETEEC